MHGVVLLLYVIQVARHLIDSKVAIDSLEQKEGVEVRVFPAGCVIKNPNRGVNHLIVSYHQQTGIKDWLLLVEGWERAGARHVDEVLLDQVHKLLVFQSPSAHNDHILSVIIPAMEVNHHLTIDLADIIYVPKNWLAHHMLPVNIEVYIFHESFLRVLIN